MTSTSSNNISSQAFANVAPLFDFSRFNEMNSNMLAETGKLNARFNTTLQNIGKEWGEFVGTRLSEDNHLFQTLQTCKSLSEAQQALCLVLGNGVQIIWGGSTAAHADHSRRDG